MKLSILVVIRGKQETFITFRLSLDNGNSAALSQHGTPKTSLINLVTDNLKKSWFIIII